MVRAAHSGRVVRIHLPSEISGIVPLEKSEAEPDLDSMDFFEVPENRLLLLKREGFRCFYTLQKLDETNFVAEHVVSRPQGDNSYKNCVAASRVVNNRKGSMSAEDFFRRLFRDGFLNDREFEDRMQQLALLKAGKIRPPIL